MGLSIKGFKTQAGQSILEAMVALGLAVIIVSAITVAVITAVGNSDFSKNQNLATQYAQQAIDLLRQQSETDWATFSQEKGIYCLSANSTNLDANGQNNCDTSAPAANISNFFVRMVTITQPQNTDCKNTTEVEVTVSWTDSKCTSVGNPFCHVVDLSSCLTNLNNAPTP